MRLGALNAATGPEAHVILWDRCRSYLLRADRSFQPWVDGLPEWGLWLLMPPIILVVMVKWACYFRRTTAVFTVMLVAIYVPLIRAGAFTFSWSGALLGLGKLIGMLYLIVASIGWTFLWQWMLWRLAGRKVSPERTGAFTQQWDREIDG